MSDLTKRCIELAAQCWCHTKTGHIAMIPELAEVFAHVLQTEIENERQQVINEIKRRREVAIDNIAVQKEIELSELLKWLKKEEV